MIRARLPHWPRRPRARAAHRISRRAGLALAGMIACAATTSAALTDTRETFTHAQLLHTQAETLAAAKTPTGASRLPDTLDATRAVRATDELSRAARVPLTSVTAHTPTTSVLATAVGDLTHTRVRVDAEATLDGPSDLARLITATGKVAPLTTITDVTLTETPSGSTAARITFTVHGGRTR